MAKDTTPTPTTALSVNQAADAIVALINAQPRSPRADEIAAVIARATMAAPVEIGETTELSLEIRRVIKEIDANNATLNTLQEEGPAWDECQRQINANQARLDELVARMPETPRSFGELLTVAEIAYHWWEKELGGGLVGLDIENPCPDEYWPPRLILAVMTMGGRIHA